jgi:hypothetical protein
MVPPEIAFLQSRSGGTMVVLVSLLLFGFTIWWAHNRSERIAALWGGAAAALLFTLLMFISMNAGWWQGAFFQLPLIVILAINLPFQIAGYTLWLGWYRWLRRKTHWAWLIYGIVILLVFIPTVFFVDPIQMQRGQFFMGGGYTILWDSVLGQVSLWTPVIFYELARKRLVKE